MLICEKLLAEVLVHDAVEIVLCACENHDASNSEGENRVYDLRLATMIHLDVCKILMCYVEFWICEAKKKHMHINRMVDNCIDYRKINGNDECERGKKMNMFELCMRALIAQI